MARVVGVLLVAGSLLEGCTPGPAPTPTFVAVATAYVSPFLEPVIVPAMQEYREQVGPLPFDLERRLNPSQIAAEGNRAVAFAAPPVPEGWFGAPFTQDSLAIITHSESGVKDLSIGQLAGLFTGRLANWSSVGGASGRVQPVIPVEGDSMRSRFSELVLGDQRFAQHALLADSPSSSIERVQEDPGAIAFVPTSSLPADVTVVRVEGASPIRSQATGRYPLTIQILFLSPQEPQGALRGFLEWIQSNPPAADSN